VPLLDCDVECIVVDDGSTDNTLRLLRNISNNIVNINIISQKNTGVSGARNNALKKAKGKYICYIDIDDVIDTGTLKKVIEYLRDNLSEELVVFPHYEGNDSKGFILKEQILHEGKNTDLMGLYKATFSQKLNEPWKKIFRADILLNNDVTFPTDMYMGEDLCMFVDYLQYIHCFTYINLPYYYYYKNDDSASAMIKTSFIEQEMKLYACLENFIQKQSLDRMLSQENDRLLLHKITRYIKGLVDHNVSKRDIKFVIIQSGAEDRLKQIEFQNKADKIRKWLLVHRKYYTLTVILKIFKGK